MFVSLRKLMGIIPVLPALITSLSGQVNFNQVGFRMQGAKTVITETSGENLFQVLRDSDGAVVHTGFLGSESTWAPSGTLAQVADFSDFHQPGIYRLSVGGMESDPILIDNRPFQQLGKAALRYYYFNRASTALELPWADAWARAGGHPDTTVYVHASAASEARPEGTVISAPKGWYDAGDYNKYVVNSGISTYTLLLLYALFPEEYANLSLDIPESGNGMPDILDEIKWNLDWLLAMQDPNDGGVYHKLTTKNFSTAVMPADATATRYVVKKSLTATYDFAALTAFAARVYEEFDGAYAATLLAASEAAYAWGLANDFNPNAVYANPPDISTGEYGDTDPGDEKRWAATELYITTGKAAYEEVGLEAASRGTEIPGWSQVNPLAQYSLALFLDNELARQKVISKANGLYSEWLTSAYRVPMLSWNYYWGSNSVAANKGMMLIVTYILTGEQKFLDEAVACLDYLCGRNPIGTSFITGFGLRTPLDPHHRASYADGVFDPVPGMLVGGPNQQKNDNCPGYPETGGPALMWVDDWCSYASNEVAINWNAPLAFLAGSLDFLTAVPLSYGAFGEDQDIGQGFYRNGFGLLWGNIDNDWIHHQRHGWMKVFRDSRGFWLHSPEAGWLWTSPEAAPWYYSYAETDWMN